MWRDPSDPGWEPERLYRHRPLTLLERLRCGGTERDGHRSWQCILREVTWDPSYDDWRCLDYYEGPLAVN